MRALLRRFALTPPGERHGLIVITSRLAVADIARWKDTAAPVLDVERLSDEAGATLLRDNGVWGTDKELKAAAHDFAGHPLALGLLASFLKETQFGDVRRRDHIRGLLHDADNPRHDHARRVMESHEKEWLADQPALLAIMHMVGLFDRPASADCLNALRKKPAIEGLTDTIVGLGAGEWNRAVARLREVRLLSPQEKSTPGTLDAHPLVRDWFGESLRKENEKAWRAAHSRLYDHLRRTTKEGKGNRPTLEQLLPLFQAIAHGCRAGRYQEALNDVLVKRIYRTNSDGTLKHYSQKQLGAFGSCLAAITWFFEKPYETPAKALSEDHEGAFVIAEAGFHLRTQVRYAEAVSAYGASLEIFEREFSGGPRSAQVAFNVAEIELLAGEVSSAVAMAERAVAHADRSRDLNAMNVSRTVLADALHAAGQRQEAEALFADAERRQKELLYSRRDYYYCDLLLSKGEWAAARDRAAQMLQRVKLERWLLDIAFHMLTLGRAHLGLALAAGAQSASSTDQRRDSRTTSARLDEAVDGLRASGTVELIPRGLLARAAFRRSIGDWNGAARDLDEVEELGRPGPMKLVLCDMAIERARLAFAQIEAFAPLNGFLETDNLPKPSPPSPDDTGLLKNDAAEQLETAANWIASCGYHKRDEELAELQAVLAGSRCFAELPARV